MSKQCGVGGCEKKGVARGWCRSHYARWRKWGDPDPHGAGPIRTRRSGEGCAIVGCNGEFYARGWCRSHYKRWKRTGNPEGVRGVYVQCSVDGCNRPHSAKGYCSTHYKRFRQNGDTGTARIAEYRHDNGPCAAEGCDRDRSVRDWCRMHYYQWYRSGEAVTDSLLGPTKRDDITYHAAHKRIAKLYGKASRLFCVGCGARAKEWAYDHTDFFNERTETTEHKNGKIRVIPYSLDPDRYEPMCKSCHITFDKAYNKGGLKMAREKLQYYG